MVVQKHCVSAWLSKVWLNHTRDDQSFEWSTDTFSPTTPLSWRLIYTAIIVQATICRILQFEKKTYYYEIHSWCSSERTFKCARIQAKRRWNQCNKTANTRSFVLIYWLFPTTALRDNRHCRDDLMNLIPAVNKRSYSQRQRFPHGVTQLLSHNIDWKQTMFVCQRRQFWEPIRSVYAGFIFVSIMSSLDDYGTNIDADI